MTPGIVRLEEPADSIVSRFTAAWVEDEALERRMRRLVAVMIAVGVLGLAGFVGAAASGKPRPLLVTAAAAVLLVVIARRWRAYKRLDIDDRKLQTVMRVLKILSADIPRRERVALTVDLRSYDAGAKHPPAVATFTDDWFRLTARLADGNVVTLTLTDRIKRKVKRKATRFACKSRIRVVLRLGKDNRPAAAVVAGIKALGRDPGLGVAGVTAGGDARVAATLRTGRLPDPARLPAGDEILRALAWVYAGVAAALRRTA
jgi:hypothetical protein